LVNEFIVVIVGLRRLRVNDIVVDNSTEEGDRSTMTDHPLRRGRPRKDGETKRSFFNTRLRDSLKLRLQSSAAQVGRSLSEEVERRLEKSVAEEDAPPDPLLPTDLRDIALELISAYAAGRSRVAPRVLEMGSPTQEERYWRQKVMETGWMTHLVNNPLLWSPQHGAGESRRLIEQVAKLVRNWLATWPEEDQRLFFELMRDPTPATMESDAAKSEPTAPEQAKPAT
jgi:plasmid stability protein